MYFSPCTSLSEKLKSSAHFIVLSIKDYYDMANNDHKPVSPETKSIQPDMCVDGNITMVKNIQPAGDYTGVSCMIYDERIMDI